MDMIFDIELDEGFHAGGSEGMQEGSGLLGCQQDTRTADGSQLGTGAVFGVWMDPRINPKVCAQPPASARRSHGSATPLLAARVPSATSGSLHQQVMVALRDIVGHSAAHQMAAALRTSGFNVRMVAPAGGRCCYSHRGCGGGGAPSVSHPGRRVARPAPRRNPAAAATGPKARRRPTEHCWTIRDPYLLVLPSTGAPCFLGDGVLGRSVDTMSAAALATTARMAGPFRRRGTFGGTASPLCGDGDGAAKGQEDDDGGSDIWTTWRQPPAFGSPRHRRHRSDLTADAELSSSAVLATSAAAAAAPLEPFVVEPGLRDLFRLGMSTPQYDKVVARLPEVWVGPRAALMELADLMCLVMEVHFRSQGLIVPPWRTRDAVMSRWDPKNQREVEHQHQAQQRRWKHQCHYDHDHDCDHHDHDHDYHDHQDNGITEQRQEEEQQEIPEKEEQEEEEHEEEGQEEEEQKLCAGICKGLCSVRAPWFRRSQTADFQQSPKQLPPRPSQSSTGSADATCAYASNPRRSSIGSGVSRGTLSSAGTEEVEEMMLGREGASPHCVLLLPGDRSNSRTASLLTSRIAAAVAAAARPAAASDDICQVVMASQPSGDEAAPRRPDPAQKLGGLCGLAELQRTTGQEQGKPGFRAAQEKGLVERRQVASGGTTMAAPVTVYGFHIAN
ncbi:hypothetical protein Vretimale_13 [Volvox reticuliferus]|uniref:Uncharacterized protein n=1 Tax=Volvox reticuliferus TaxID=1737510 RepID=A0A8J4CB77_9CHLO|nr:hypothetical protein Vretifemale_8381 [Volvox reticuliferus]GIL93697.1 hypothetical protein Vretimale_13 [Volvox reticuliferus]